MKKVSVLLLAALLCMAAAPVFAGGGKEGTPQPAAGAGGRPFEGVTLRIFANSHEPMLRAVKWSVPVVKKNWE